jgi:5-methylcytosine-specific restriction endonuclease McrA
MTGQKGENRTYQCRNPQCNNPEITITVLRTKYKKGIKHPIFNLDGSLALHIPASPSLAQKKIRKLLPGIITCELCGYSRVLEVCHIVAKQNGGNYTLDNVFILCRNCHWLFDHNGLTTEEKTKLQQIKRKTL